MLSRRRGIVFSIALIVLISTGLSLTAPTLAQSGAQAILVLKIIGLRSEKGQVKIAVFNSAEKWLGEQPVYSSTISVESQTVLCKINDVPYGDYGIAVFHDENKNGKMDKNLLGIPAEAYGFSNNVRVTFGPPTWGKAKFVVNSPSTDVSIEVK